MGMCKLTKTTSPVLSLYLETVYVNEVAARGYAVRPNLDVPSMPLPFTRPVAGKALAAPE